MAEEIKRFEGDKNILFHKPLGTVYIIFNKKWMGRTVGNTILSKIQTVVDLPRAQGASGKAVTNVYFELAADFVDLNCGFMSTVDRTISQPDPLSESLAFVDEHLYEDITLDAYQLEILPVGSDGDTVELSGGTMCFYKAAIIETDNRPLYTFGIDEQKVYNVVFQIMRHQFKTPVSGGPTVGYGYAGDPAKLKMPTLAQEA